MQGPRIAELFHALFGAGVNLPPRNSMTGFGFDGTTVWVARTGGARKARAISKERRGSCAATALRRLRERRAHRRSNKRHPFSELELGRGHGVCLDGARENRRPNRYRNTRTKVPSHHGKATALQK